MMRTRHCLALPSCFHVLNFFPGLSLTIRPNLLLMQKKKKKKAEKKAILGVCCGLLWPPWMAEGFLSFVFPYLSSPLNYNSLWFVDRWCNLVVIRQKTQDRILIPVLLRDDSCYTRGLTARYSLMLESEEFLLLLFNTDIFLLQHRCQFVQLYLQVTVVPFLPWYILLELAQLRPKTADLTVFILSQVIDHLHVTAGEFICGSLNCWTGADL